MCEKKDNSQDLEYKESLASLRHYGNMRFAILTLFTTLTAGLFAANFNENYVSENIPSNFLIKIAPIALTIFFLQINKILSIYINTLGKLIYDTHECHLNSIPRFTSSDVSELFDFFYEAILLFWMINTLVYLFEIKDCETLIS